MSDGEKNVFDRLITLSIPHRFQPFFAAHREQLMYLLFGGISFLLSVGCYTVFLTVFSLDTLTANLLSWILTVAFVYATNRRWVFKGGQKRGAERRRQIFSFYAGRTLTLLVEEAFIAVFAVSLGLPGVPVKVFAQIIVILLNYIISKKLIFKG